MKLEFYSECSVYLYKNLNLSNSTKELKFKSQRTVSITNPQQNSRKAGKTFENLIPVLPPSRPNSNQTLI
jgi:hypothetical protein